MACMVAQVCGVFCPQVVGSKCGGVGHCRSALAMNGVVQAKGALQGAQQTWTKPAPYQPTHLNVLGAVVQVKEKPSKLCRQDGCVIAQVGWLSPGALKYGAHKHRGRVEEVHLEGGFSAGGPLERRGMGLSYPSIVAPDKAHASEGLRVRH